MILNCLLNSLRLNADVSLGGGCTAVLQEPLYQRNIEAVGIVGRKGVEFVSLKENIDTTTPQGRFMLTVFGALAELERENILERTEKKIFHQTFHDWTKKRRRISPSPLGFMRPNQQFLT